MKIASGLDVHKDSVFVCILHENGEKIQQKFGVLTEELDLMLSEGVEECAMESTSIYWMPVWRVLERDQRHGHRHHLATDGGDRTAATP